MYNSYELFNPILAGGVYVPPVLPWVPTDPDSDLLQYWDDILEPSIANPEVLSYRPILQYNAPANAGSLRPYQPGRCYQGDGAACVDCGSDPSLDITDAITICGWVNAALDSTGTLVGSDISSLSSGYWFGWNIHTAPNLYVYLNGVKDIKLEDTMVYEEDVFLSFTWDGITIKIYLNGIEIHSEPATGTITTWVSTLIGSAQYIFKGTVEDVHIYASGLTEAEIKALYSRNPNHPDWPSNSTLRLHAKCDEGSGDTCYDSSGQGNHGSILNNYTGFHSQQSQYSFQNEVGYSKPSDVYIPRNELIPTQDVLGNPLQYTGRASGYGVLKNLPCGSFDGVGTGVSITGSLAVSDWTVFIKFRTNTVELFSEFLLDFKTPRVTFGFNAATSDGVYVFFDSVSYFELSSSRLDDSNWHSVGISKTGTAFISDIDGIAANGGTCVDINISAVVDAAIGSSYNSGGSWFDGKVAEVRIYSTGLTATELTALAIGDTTDPNYPPDTNLVGYWPFSENGGTTVHDISGNNNHGQWQNYNIANIWGTQDQYAYNQVNGFNRRLWLNGVDSKVSTEIITYAPNTLTVLTWVFIDDTLPSVYTRIVAKDDSTEDLVGTFQITYGAVGKLGFRVRSGSIWYGDLDFVDLPTGQWCLIGGVYDKVNVIGVLNGTTYTLEANSGNLLPTLDPVAIGHRSSSGDHFKGIIQGVVLFSRALDATELQSIYDAGPGTPIENRTNLDHEYPLNDINPPALTRVRSYNSIGPDIHDLGSTLDATSPMWISGWISGSVGTILEQGTNFKLANNGVNIDWTVDGITVSVTRPSDTEQFYFMAVSDGTNITLALNDGVAATTVKVPPATLDGTFQISSIDLIGTVGFLYFGTGVTPTLYNNGLGYHYLDNPAGTIVSAWMGNETSGELFDWVGSNHLVVSSGDPQSSAGFRDTLVEDTAGGYTGKLSGGYNWLDQPVAAGEVPEEQAGRFFLPALEDQIDWVDFLNSNTNFPWAQPNAEQIGWPNNYQYGDTTGGRHLATRDQFAKLNYNKGISKFLNYRDNLEDPDLTKAKEYVTLSGFSSGFSEGFN